MEYVNGKARDGVGAPPPVGLTAVTQPVATSTTGDDSKALVIANTTDTERFMPVMNIEQAIARRDTIVQATQRLMTVGVDYGKIPGTDRDVLLQPGADKLCNLFGIVIEYTVEAQIEDWTGQQYGEPFFYYKVRGRAFRGQYLMGEGVGSCNSWESKYRWRKLERTCPSCGKENIRKSNRGDGWYCWQRTGGCGATFPPGSPLIENQQVGRKPNPDIADVVNTVLKIAYKRCKVGTTINATSASEFFTQDVEDFSDDEEPRVVPINTGGNPVGTQAAATYVAEQKIQSQNPATSKPWNNAGEMRRAYAKIREEVGETIYLEELARYNWRSTADIRSEKQAIECYHHLASHAERARNRR